MAIIEYHVKARCKDCEFCGYIRPLKKDGEFSRRKQYYCALGHKDWIGAMRLSSKDYACSNFNLSQNGSIMPFHYAAGDRPF